MMHRACDELQEPKFPARIFAFLYLCDHRDESAVHRDQEQAADKQRKGLSEEQTSLSNGNDFRKELESALRDRTRSLRDAFRRRRRRHDQIVNDETTQMDENFDSQIECPVPGSALVDMTSISMLSALVTPNLDDSRTLFNFVRRRDSEHDSLSNPDCPIKSLAASNAKWWDRPIWAWTWNEILLAHGAILASSLLLDIGLSSWTVSISTDKCLAQLRCFHCCHGSSCCKRLDAGAPILVDPVADDQVICRIVRSGLSAKDQVSTADPCRSLLKRFGRKQPFRLSKELELDIERLIHSSAMAEVITDFQDVAKRDIPKSLDHAATTEDVNSQCALAVETPQEERIKLSRHELRTPQEENAEMPDLARKECECQSTKTEPELPMPPQIDSRGIDVTMLSQLPASIRSEARIAAVLREGRSNRTRKAKPAIRGSLPTWFPPASKMCVPANQAKSLKDKRKNGWPSAGQIDLETLRELPEGIQASIMSELAHEALTLKKRTGITKFFPSTIGKKARR